jgi:exodeoxyribonuclease V alpha subunit
MSLPPPDPRVLASLSPLDRSFAEALGRFVPDADPWVLVAAAAASHALQNGDSCLDLARAARQLTPREGPIARAAPPPLPDHEAWAALLLASPLVSDSGATVAPLVLTRAADGGYRLHLWRYYEYQQRFASRIRARRGHIEPMSRAELDALLDPLFPPERAPTDGPDLQRAAAELALTRTLAVIAGGPGTGKTTTVLRILAALLASPDPLRRPGAIALAAPTGKAAARLSEAIRDGLATLPLPASVRDRIPTRAITLHRLLSQSSPWVAGAAGARLDHASITADLLVIDEASMVDLALMTRVIEALRPEARLILLGDKDQLASVQAGRVLIDLVRAAEADGPLVGNVVELTRTHRFGATIGAFAEAIRRGDVDAALACLEDTSESAPLRWCELSPNALIDFAVDRWRPFFTQLDSPESALAQLGAFQLLTAHRHGPYGAQTLGPAIRQRLAERGIIPLGTAWDTWFHGRTVLITENDHALGLANGDVGVALVGPDGARRVHFPRSEADDGDRGRTRALSPGQLPNHEPWWAATTHKAQGSGFDHVAIALPPEPTPLCSRELLYTAVTRARQGVTLIMSRETLVHAIRTPTERVTGLDAALL